MYKRQLERRPGDAETLNATFRSFHTIKGLAGFLGFGAVQEVAHQTETILDQARSGCTVLTAESIDIILRASDYLKAAFNHIEAHGRHDEHAPQALLRTIAEASRIGEDAAEPAVEATPVLTSVTIAETLAPPSDSEPEPVDPHAGAAEPTTSEPAPAQTSSDKPSAAAIKVDADKIEHPVSYTHLASRKVRILAFDPDRAGATHQLRHFAEIAGIGFAEFDTPEELRLALGHRLDGLTLIDLSLIHI